MAASPPLQKWLSRHRLASFPFGQAGPTKYVLTLSWNVVVPSNGFGIPPESPLILDLWSDET
uniref:Uncharacterized protein n=1 Tax=Talaromyces marneffei PM1 TaxID=1077442 RepID=A0A093VDC9_TALMA